jgi:hypothetical protein
MNKALDKGLPNDPRFPERDNQWLTERTKEHTLLVEWLENFRSQFGEYSEADATFQECSAVLEKYATKVEKIRKPLEIQNAVLAKDILEYGLDHHLTNLRAALEKGLPNDPRFPERDNEFVTKRDQEHSKLSEWVRAPLLLSNVLSGHPRWL